MEYSGSFKSGFISILGSPNVGKSTLLNSFVGQKISIVSNKAQTTRNKIIGVLTRGDRQMIFIDTPGIHDPRTKLGEYMVDAAYSANRDVDVTLFMIDSKAGFGERDQEILSKLSKSYLLVAVNKTDLVSREDVEKIHGRLHGFSIDEEHIVDISALYGTGIYDLENRIMEMLPEGPKYYPEDTVTDMPEKFICAEFIREKALYFLRDEIPHGIGIEIEKVTETDELISVYAVIICEKSSHKGIIIGRNGSMLKRIASESRKDMEMLFGTKVYLEVFVKVKDDWRNSNFMLKELGYRKEDNI